LQECLEMRKRYVFKEAVAPWDKEVISDPSTPKPNPQPFFYALEGKSIHYFEMQDGVIHVYPNKDYLYCSCISKKWKWYVRIYCFFPPSGFLVLGKRDCRFWSLVTAFSLIDIFTNVGWGLQEGHLHKHNCSEP
ncbi:hypothetical protein HN51_022061, partial [Arachis hypogaea]